MKTLRNSKFLAVFGALAVMLAVTLVAAPSAEAGGYGYHTNYVSTCHAPVHYVAPVYPTYNYVAPIYQTYYTPTYFGYGCHYPW